MNRILIVALTLTELASVSGCTSFYARQISVPEPPGHRVADTLYLLPKSEVRIDFSVEKIVFSPGDLLEVARRAKLPIATERIKEFEVSCPGDLHNKELSRYRLVSAQLGRILTPDYASLHALRTNEVARAQIGKMSLPLDAGNDVQIADTQGQRALQLPPLQSVTAGDISYRADLDAPSDQLRKELAEIDQLRRARRDYVATAQLKDTDAATVRELVTELNLQESEISERIAGKTSGSTSLLHVMVIPSTPGVWELGSFSSCQGLSLFQESRKIESNDLTLCDSAGAIIPPAENHTASSLRLRLTVDEPTSTFACNLSRLARARFEKAADAGFTYRPAFLAHASIAMGDSEIVRSAFPIPQIFPPVTLYSEDPIEMQMGPVYSYLKPEPPVAN